jgi:hypothetical protein
MAIATSGFLDGFESDWYAVVCDRFVSMDDMPSKHRSEVRRGLRNCQVRRIAPFDIAARGYEVFIAAVTSYSRLTYKICTAAQFRERLTAERDFSDVIHYWGVFHDDALIAYSQNMVFGSTEVNYSSIKIDPKHLSLYPSYALIYTMNEYYLNNGFAYVNDGWRSIQHDTNVQQFLIRKFCFRRAFTRLLVNYRPVISMGLRAAFPLRHLLHRIHPKIAVLLTVEEIRRRCDGTLSPKREN